jgi:hypothetical protein
VNPANIAASVSGNLLDGVDVIEQGVATTSFAIFAEAKTEPFFSGVNRASWGDANIMKWARGGWSRGGEAIG